MLRGAVASNLLVEPSCFREEVNFTNNWKMKRTTLLNDPVLCSRDQVSTPFSVGYFSGKSIPFGCCLQIVQRFQEKADKSTAQHSKKPSKPNQRVSTQCGLPGRMTKADCTLVDVS
jgi:hypothetical protein